MVAIPPKKNLTSARAAATKAPREAELEAEVARLESRNNRLGKAMLSLVNHIERKLPFLGTKTPVLVPSQNRAAEKQTAGRTAAPVQATTPSAREAGQNWKPAVLVQEKAGDALLKKRSHGMAAQQPTAIQSAETEAIIFGDTAPALTPPEIEILKSPTQYRQESEKPAAGKRGTGSEAAVAREAKKTSAQQAADAYEAVAVVSTPVPDETPEDNTKQDDNRYRLAMRKRVNRLRW